MTRTRIDRIFVNGSLFVDAARPTERLALAVGNGRITAIGDEDELRSRASRSTEFVDLRGGLLSPGFRDSHIHAVYGGVGLGQCSMHECETAETCFQAIVAYAEAHPEHDWIVGGGWNMDSFPGGTPTVAMLDAVCADRPAYLIERGAHSAWVNTRALANAGIDRDTPDPADGRIGRDERGEPNGMLYEGAMALVAELLPPLTRADYDDALVAAERYAFSCGITGWQDAIVGAYGGFEDQFDVYNDADRAGTLRADVVGALWWDRNRGLEQIDDLVARRAAAHGDRFRATSVKLMLDGVVEAKTASMIHPYRDACGHTTDNHGLRFIDREELIEAVVRLDALGFQPHFHALGDQAARDALDAVEAARLSNGVNDTRPHIAHLQVVQPVDIPRFRTLGVTANLQPLWACALPTRDELIVPFLGPERVQLQWPYGAIHRAGAGLAAGSDWPVSSPHPLLGMHIAANRQPPADLAEGMDIPPFLPAERIGLAGLWRAYTLGSAQLAHADVRSGTLEVGKDADLVVLDRDPFASDDAEIFRTQIRGTYVRGEQVYDAPA
ncbi:amidohydrolase [Agromyces sp. Root81]|uniref:amidohydrolase n=1 Tax=Agromyces sp. Root81 TaxID=1736601 RepID=UPI0006F632D9|nr:amidohydrolase [Agromyces sp. Root81]KRC61942.1 amidohydrolase [Agromyces sp. Root81]